MASEEQSPVILEVKDLATSFETEAGRARAVEEVGFQVRAGRTLGIVGESGCGKSVTALSLMRLLPKPSGQIEEGHILYKGTDLLGLTAGEMHRIRGNRISMIFQEPMTALNPVHKVGRQLAEVYSLHFPEKSRDEVRRRCIEMLEMVGIPLPEQRLDEYPHQLSGGMRQRVMIAIALACEPDILIADEPTTALDVTIQAQILHLMADLQQRKGTSIILITHDLGVVAGFCDDVLVMYAGQTVEMASVEDLFARPEHPYTRALLASIPSRAKVRKSVLPTIAGMVPAPGQMPAGCRFENRCGFALPECRAHQSISERGTGFVRCGRAGDPALEGEET